jgi:hypothetical protein
MLQDQLLLLGIDINKPARSVQRRFKSIRYLKHQLVNKTLEYICDYKGKTKSNQNTDN